MHFLRSRFAPIFAQKIHKASRRCAQRYLLSGISVFKKSISIVLALMVSACGGKDLANIYALEQEPYFIEFPSEYSFRNMEVETGLGDVKVSSISSKSNSIDFNLSVSELPLDNLEEDQKIAVLESAKIGASKATDGIVTLEVEKVHAGITMREFTLSIDEGEFMVISRVFSIGNNFYQMTVTSPKSQFLDPQVRSFLDSFQEQDNKRL
ncbi:hypothetical protein [Microbulbifer sp. Q7]|uniref:hypothetical protein n=1 Tax=Microbulbifer sp. Q7 TaxID=1785091 RepID=UPI0012901D04|nr:hypothetical protein [Microbulbifer sp. Q7]